jgi:hypothetical protein
LADDDSVALSHVGDNCEPRRLASMVMARSRSGPMPMPVISSVGGMRMVRPSSVVNWLLSESLPLTKGVR